MTQEYTIASRIIERRAKLGWSQEDLARESGIAPAQISRYESGKNKPRANIIAKLSEAMMVPFSWLAYGDEKDLMPSPQPDEEGSIDFYISVPDEDGEKLEQEAKSLGLTVNELANKRMRDFINADTEKINLKNALEKQIRDLKSHIESLENIVKKLP